jgi:membrane protein YdbS with pleckstrin-like domain
MKTVSQQPSVWYVIVTVVAMIYLSDFSINVLAAIFDPTLSSGALTIGFALAAVWAFLIYDLIRQVSLFFRRKAE